MTRMHIDPQFKPLKFDDQRKPTAGLLCKNRDWSENVI